MAEEWKLDGTYMEACTCQSVCPCVFLSPPSEGDCKALVAWHIDQGHLGDTKLDNLNVALALHSPGNMKDGDWSVALYLDDRASKDQQEALTRIFGGQAGGHPAVLGEHISKVMGVATKDIDFEEQGKRRALRIGDVGSFDIEAVAGQNEQDVTVSNTPLAVAPGYPSVAARSKHAEYHDHGQDWTISDRNGFFSHFTYQSQ